MEFITTNKYGEENGYLRHCGVELNVGQDNDFEIKVQNKYYDKEKHWFGCLFYCPDTEYGGIIRGINPVTEDGIVKLTGPIWRGMLAKKAIRPDVNDYLYLNGEANLVLKGLIKSLSLDSLFAVSDDDSGIVFHNYQVPLQEYLLTGFTDALERYSGRVEIKYISGEANGKGYVLLQVKKTVDYSEQTEISEDGNVKLNILDYRDGVNHLICLGKGELAERHRVDLYAWPDGSVRKEQYYTGLEESVLYYENTSSESVDDLEADGRDKFEDVKNYKQLRIAVSDMDLELGDIVGGRERITEITMKSPVVRKIITVNGKGKLSIDYKLKGEN